MLLPTMPPWAMARMSGGEGNPQLGGTVQFYPIWDGVLVIAQINGLPKEGEGVFAMHIHEGRVCSGEDFSDAGGHYNPEEKLHPMHAGDMPPLFRCCGGRAYLAFVTDRFSIPDVVGRTVIIHSGPDDFHTQPAGNSASRIGCGVIQKV